MLRKITCCSLLEIHSSEVRITREDQADKRGRAQGKHVGSRGLRLQARYWLRVEAVYPHQCSIVPSLRRKMNAPTTAAPAAHTKTAAEAMSRASRR